MSHVRKQIRDAAVTALTPTPGIVAVFGNHVKAIEVQELPLLIVSTDTETAATIDKGGAGLAPTVQRTLPLAVTVVVDGDTDTLDDDLDVIAVEVETRLAGTLGGLVKRLTMTGSELELLPDEEGAQWFGFMAITFDAVVQTREGEPEVAL